MGNIGKIGRKINAVVLAFFYEAKAGTSYPLIPSTATMINLKVI